MKLLQRKILGALTLGLMLILSGPCNSADAIQRLKLKNMTMAQSEHGRQLLKYLVSCALGPGLTVGFDVAGQSFEYPGGLGLVPHWSRRALTLNEEQLISACILARTNYFGKTVELSMRSESPSALLADEAELRDFTFFEAAFFGNIFKDEPEYFVCLGDPIAEREKHLEALLRVCSLSLPTGPSPVSSHSELGKSRCGFLIVGYCSSKPFRQNKQDYSRSVLQIYLPGK
jgi:hypothetical protein